jgi:hypothetical protein
MKFLILFFLFISVNSYSTCLEELRQVIAESKVSSKVPAEVRETINSRIELFNLKLESLKAKHPSALREKNQKIIDLLIEKMEKRPGTKAVLEILVNEYLDPQLATNWMRGLAEEMLQRTERRGNPEQKKLLHEEFKFSEEILLEVLGSRLEAAGFPKGNFKDVHFLLENDQFLDLLHDRLLIVDRTFSTDGHGAFIHVFQMDFLRFLLVHKKLSPKLLGEFYEWMGIGERFPLGENHIFEPGNDIWDTFFDGYNFSIYRPEIFNVKIEEVISL